MCTNIHKIRNKYTGQELFVKCGHCPACLQEKASASANKIRNNYKLGLGCLFVTLNYDNDHIPVIQRDDLENYCFTDFYYNDNNDLCVNIPLRRGIYSFDRDPICNIEFPVDKINDEIIDELFSFHPGIVTKVRNHKPVAFDTNHFSICCTLDIQLFFKRLRQKLYRKLHFRPVLQYFQTSEYGPTTYRAHFHIVLFYKISEISFDALRDAICKAWPFCSRKQMFRNVEISRDAASYVASYVNCRASVCRFFNLPQTKSKHSHSLYFGHHNDLYSFDKIVDRFETQGTTLCPRNIVLSDATKKTSYLPLPCYVQDFYFPKFKGMRLLDDSELYLALRMPESTLSLSFREKTQLSKDDDFTGAYRVIKRCFSHQSRFESIEDWAYFVLRFIQRRRSDSIRLMHIKDGFFNDIRYIFDNILDYYTGKITSSYLDDNLLSVYSDGFEVDPNNFPQNVAMHNNLMKKFDYRCKQRKISYYLSL